MTREHLDYRATRAPGKAAAGALDPDDPKHDGYYRFKLRSGGHPVAIFIWHGPPHDPDTGDVMERSWRWQAKCNGQPIDLERVWPACGGEPISEDEHDHLVMLHCWGKEHAPDGPQANPQRKIDPLSAPLPF